MWEPGGENATSRSRAFPLGGEMIKASGQCEEGMLLFIGLSEENLVRMRAGMPADIGLGDFQKGLPAGRLVIGYGRTEQEMEAEFRRGGLIRPGGTAVERDPRADAHNDLKTNEAKVLILTMGLPRSGKSTWARTQGYPIICPDEIRTALHGHRFIAEAEPYVWAIARTMVRALFGAGHQFVILDACNTTRKRRDEWKTSEWASRFKCFFESVDTCMNRAEAAGDPDIGPIIQRMADQFEPRGDDEVPFQ